MADLNPNLTLCGIGSWRPKWLQVFANPWIFLLNMSIVGIIQSMTGSIFFSTMSTLEKRYAFDSTISGIILIADNISQLMLSPFIGYIAIRFNRARLIAIGELILALSCFLTTLPYFLYGHAEHLLKDDEVSRLMVDSVHKQTKMQYCTVRNETETCSLGGQSEVTVWPAVIILFIGSFFRGLGFNCFFVIGYPYMDDNVSKKNTAIYFSLMQTIRILGPASGFMLASLTLRLYENPFIDPGVTRTDPRFVGAWWLGFFVVGVLLFIASLPLLLFPAEFKNASVQSSTLQQKLTESGGSIQALKRFLTNPIVMLYLISNTFRYSGIGGLFMFSTKYIEAQYRQTSSKASFITGTVSILPMAFGLLFGGLFITILKPSPRVILIYVFLMESVTIFTTAAGMFLGAEPVRMAGHGTTSGLLNLTTSCNQHCACTNNIFSPLCASDQKTTYFSPCHAGCYDQIRNNTFSGCSCLADSATLGYCGQDLQTDHNLNWYMLVNLIGSVISSGAVTANALITFRSVDPMDKSFTMGTASSLLAILSFIPYPLIFGHIVDSTCLVWETKCGKTGNCWLYDQKKFRNHLHGATVLFTLVASVIDFFLIFFADRIKNLYDDGEEAATVAEPTEQIELN